MSRNSFILLIIILLLILITVIIINWTLVSATFHAYDISILDFMNSRRIEALDPVLVAITNSSSYLAIGSIGVVFIASFIKKSHMLRRSGFELLCSFLLAFVLIKGLKYTIGRIRPFDRYNYIEQLVDIGTPSFPSGHTLESAAIATSIVLLFRSRILSAIAIIWALTVALSRIILGVHYPSDVAAGIVLGILTAYLCHRAFLKRTVNASEIS